MTTLSMRIMGAGFCALLVTGCGKGQKEGHEHEGSEAGHVEAGVEFRAKKGLFVPEGTAKFIGLEVAEVEEKKVESVVRFSAQVYRTAGEAQFASLKAAIGSTALATALVNSNEVTSGATVSITSSKGKELMGRVTEILERVTMGKGQVEALIQIQDPEGILQRGETVEVLIRKAGEKAAITIPRNALLQTVEGNFVYTVSGEHYVRTAVKVGTVTEDSAQITEGLLSGDQIVTKPVMTLWMAELQGLRGGKACADGH